jgi:hypothetical protein
MATLSLPIPQTMLQVFKVTYVASLLVDILFNVKVNASDPWRQIAQSLDQLFIVSFMFVIKSRDFQRV